MITDKLHRLAQERAKQIQSKTISWIIHTEKFEATSICLKSNKPIKIKKIYTEPNFKETPIISGSEAAHKDCQPSSLLEGGEYIARWNRENQYFLKLDLETPVNFESIKIYSNNNNTEGEWIFGGSVLLQDKGGNTREISYDDGIAWDSLECVNLDIKELFKNASNRRAPKETFALYRKIRGFTDETTAQSIEQHLRGILGPHTLSPHGYLKNLDAIQQKELGAGLVGVIEQIESQGYSIFAASGTLLGAIRNGKFISHDDDVDFGVIMRGSTLEEAVASMKKFEHIMIEAGLLRTPLFKIDPPTFHWKLKYIAGVNVDLFPAWINGGKVYAWPYCHGDAATQDLMPIRRIRIQDIEVPAPARPEKFLELNYGPNWRIPDPTFHFDWPSASKRFSDFIAKIKFERKKAKK